MGLSREDHCSIHNAHELCCGHRDHCGPSVQGKLQFKSGLSGKNAVAAWIHLVPLAQNRSLGVWMSSQITLWIRGCALFFWQFTLKSAVRIHTCCCLRGRDLEGLGDKLDVSCCVAAMWQSGDAFKTDWVGIFSAGNNSSCPANETLYFSATLAILFFQTGSTENDAGGLRAGLTP